MRPVGASHRAEVLPAVSPRGRVRVRVEDCRGLIRDVPARSVLLNGAAEFVCPVCGKYLFAQALPEVVPRAVASA